LIQPLSAISSIDNTSSQLMYPRFTFVDLFSGIGGFRIPLEKLGGKCLGYSEIDKQAIRVYQQNFDRLVNSDEVYLGDINNLDKLEWNIDILTGGVPCQSWSIAGKGEGFKDPRGALWFKVIQFVISNKPKSFIFENVKGLAEPRNQDSLNYIVQSFEAAGYTVKYTVLNSYDFGLSQDRDRIFIVGIRTDLENHDRFNFPKPLNTYPKLYDFIDDLDLKFIAKKKFKTDILFNGKIPGSRGRFQKNDELNDFFTFADIRDGHTTIHSWDIIPTTDREKFICYTILRNRRKKIYGEKDGNPLSFSILRSIIDDLEEIELIRLIDKLILRFVRDKGYEFVNSKISSGINGVSKIFLPHADVVGTLTATGTRDYISTISIPCQEPTEYKKTFINEVYLKKNFRALSSKDYAKLQGFPDRFIMAKNETVAKRQLGNAVSIPVVYYLSQEVLKVIL
jgi:DNA (cytosine-5)-methyltransferase 1